MQINLSKGGDSWCFQVGWMLIQLPLHTEVIFCQESIDSHLLACLTPKDEWILHAGLHFKFVRSTTEPNRGTHTAGESKQASSRPQKVGLLDATCHITLRALTKFRCPHNAGLHSQSCYLTRCFPREFTELQLQRCKPLSLCTGLTRLLLAPVQRHHDPRAGRSPRPGAAPPPRRKGPETPLPARGESGTPRRGPSCRSWKTFRTASQPRGSPAPRAAVAARRSRTTTLRLFPAMAPPAAEAAGGGRQRRPLRAGRDGDGTGIGTGPPPVPARRVRGGSPEPLRGKGLAASGGLWGDGGLGRARPSRGAALKGEERRRPPQHGCEGKGQRSAVWGGSPRNRL